MEIAQQRRDLIEGLLLEAGRIMEDSSPELAQHLPDDAPEIDMLIDQLARNASALSALARAAQAMLEQHSDGH